MSLSTLLADLDNESRAQYEDKAIIAGEAVTTEVEKEYCAWVKADEAAVDGLNERGGSVIVDILLPIDGGRRRVRIEDGKATLTLKRWSDAGTVEEHSELGLATALTFIKDSDNIHVFKRVTFNADIAEAPGSKWDIDLFIEPHRNELATLQTAKDFDDFIGMIQSQGILPWIKVELEVKEFFTDSIRELVPFEHTDYTPSRVKDDTVQAMLAHNWDVVTNWV